MVCVPMGRGYVQNKNDCNEQFILPYKFAFTDNRRD